MAKKSAADVISVPKGGGALRGLGEKFAPDLFTGTGNFRVPLELPPGRNGFQPALELAYSTGQGNSPFGLGWSISVPEVARKTSKGIPRYGREDTFVLSGIDDLVELAAPAGDPHTTHYRPRTEGAFSRIAHVQDGVSDYWVIHAKDGTVSTFGTPRPGGAGPDWMDEAAVADPRDVSRKFCWKLSETRDPLGNRIQYRYARDERGPGPGQAWTQTYLTAVFYAERGDASQVEYLISLELEYEGRPDVFSDRRAGFEVRTRKRCNRLLVSTNTDQKRRLRSYELTYQGGLPQASSASSNVSLLSELCLVGHDDERGATQKMPSLRFDYGRFEPEKRRFIEVAGDQLPAVSLADPRYELVDLFGRGLPDIVEIADVVRYWRNLGDGRFDRPRLMRESPGLHLGDPGVQLMDVNGDGRAELVVSRPEVNGYFPLSTDGQWKSSSFRPQKQAPSFLLHDPEVKLVDLDGDGVTDAIRSSTAFECIYNDAALGWRAIERIERGRAPEFPDVSFADPRVKWADMSGDGLTDIVLVHGDRVDYWPSLGRGKFAPRITMQNAPRLPRDYNPSRVLLGDVTGDGTADLVYVGDDRVTLWLNQAGNSWSEPFELRGTPKVTDLDAVRLVDLLGTGTAGILWSRGTTLPGGRAYFLDLTGGRKPHLLEGIDNGLGAVTRVEYTPSTRQWLNDQANGKPWRTSLPFPVQLVARVEVVDRFSGCTLTTEYAYHHGHWDGVEREFRGFGRVDQWDAARFPAGSLATGEGRSAPPTETRTWFHLGASGVGPRTLEYSSEYWLEDPQVFDDPDTPSGTLAKLPLGARHDGQRALRGRVLRSELYGRDDSTLSARPYSVTEHSYELRLESLSERGAAVFPFEVASRTTQWERGADPLTKLVYSGDHDAYGQPGLKLDLAVPRGRDFRRTATFDSESFLATQSITAYAQRDEPAVFIADRVAHQTQFEIINDGRPDDSVDPKPSAFALWERVRDATARRRVLAQTLHYYDGADFEGLPLGELGPAGLLKRTEQLVLTASVLHDGYRSDATVTHPPEEPPFLTTAVTPVWSDEYPEAFRAAIEATATTGHGRSLRCGYVFHEGDLVRSRGYFAATLQVAHDSRGTVVMKRDDFGSIVRIELDTYQLLPTRVTNAANLTTTAENDYRVLAPRLIRDHNDNCTEYRFNALGLVESIALLGKPGLREGDLSEAPSTQFVYGLHRVDDGRDSPVFVHTLQNVQHSGTSAAGTTGGESLEGRVYWDGFGRSLQARALAEEWILGDPSSGGEVLPADQTRNGPAIGAVRDEGTPPNVIVSGWQVYDEKGRVVEKFEPFFSQGWEYRAPIDVERGQRTRMRYDALGRTVRTIHPNGSEDVVVHGRPASPATPDDFAPSPWETWTYDVNDNAGRTPAADPKQLSPKSHWNTPSTAVIDARGRVVEQVRRNGPDPADWLVTHFQFDILGRMIEARDELGRLALRQVFDHQGRVLRSEGLGGTVRRSVFSSNGSLVEQRDARGALQLHARDVLLRPRFVWARDSENKPTTLRERVIYGDAAESGISRDTAVERNLLGSLYKHYDEAGLLTLSAYDFNGNVLQRSRRVLSDTWLLHAFESAGPTWQVDVAHVDWEPPPGQSLDALAAEALETTDYVTSHAYDALNRETALTCPAAVDGTRARVERRYDRSGALRSVRVDGTAIVSHIAYNARRQRTLIALGELSATATGPHTMTRYAYDAKTFRLVRLRSEGFLATADGFVGRGPLLEDRAYDHDLAGNPVAIHERSPNCGVAETPDALDRTFGYDALYRLVSETGRECDSSTGDLYDAGPWCHDGTQTRSYRRIFEYDAAGNLTQVAKTLPAKPEESWPTRFVDVGSNTNHVSTLRVGSHTSTYAYDAAGNIVRENTERHFEWDRAGRLRVFRVQPEGSEPSQHVQYLCDSAGARVKKLVRKQGGRVEVTVYIGGVFEASRVLQGPIRVQNNTIQVTDGESPVASLRIGAPAPGDSTPAKKFYFSDQVGHCTLVVDQDGSWLNREEYSPYGDTTFGSYARKRYRFGGKERDEESGLYYFGARYYAPWLGRWISPDPAGAVDGLNLYAYTRGNPLRWRDPGGATTEPSLGEFRLRPPNASLAPPPTVTADAVQKGLGPIWSRPTIRLGTAPDPGLLERAVHWGTRTFGTASSPTNQVVFPTGYRHRESLDSARTFSVPIRSDLTELATKAAHHAAAAAQWIGAAVEAAWPYIAGVALMIFSPLVCAAAGVALVAYRDKIVQLGTKAMKFFESTARSGYVHLGVSLGLCSASISFSWSSPDREKTTPDVRVTAPARDVETSPSSSPVSTVTPNNEPAPPADPGPAGEFDLEMGPPDPPRVQYWR